MEIKPNIAYHCATKELIKQFMKEAEEQGYSTIDRDLLYDNIEYFNLADKEKICWGTLQDYKKDNYKIVEYTGKESLVIQVLNLLEKPNATWNDLENILKGKEHFAEVGKKIEPKVETAWVIQRDDGRFYTECSVKDVKYTKNIWCAFKFNTKEEIEWCVKGIKELQNCKPIRVEIRMMEE